MKLRNIITVLFVVSFFVSCAPAPTAVSTKTAVFTSTFIPAPTVTATPCLGLAATPASTPLPWSYADDYWNSVAISRISTQDMECADSIEIIRKLVLQWLEIIKTNSPNQQCGLEDYTLDTIVIKENTITPQYDIVAGVGYHLKPGRFGECGWISDRGQIEENGWIKTSDTFGVYRENGYFRLIILPGWGT